MWLGFTRQYSDIQLELHLSNEKQDMARYKADIAIRVGQLKRILLASPGYLNESQLLSHPAQLKEHSLIDTRIHKLIRLTRSR